MKNYTDLTISAKAVVIFKNVMTDKCLSSLLNLLKCDRTDKDEFVSLYSDFVSALYEKTDDLCEYINQLLQNDENIYVKESAKGDASPLIQKAVENELDLFEKLSQISCDDIKVLCDTDVYLPQWKNSSLSVKGEYIKNTIKSWNSRIVKDIRGKGLMIGIDIVDEIKVFDIEKKLLEAGVLSSTAGKNTLRLVPPLNITYKEISEGLNILKSVLQ